MTLTTSDTSRKTSISIGLLVAILGAIGCGGAPLPAEEMTTAKAATRAAEVGGAESVPKAALHLKYAKDQLAQAKAAVDEGDNEKARILAIRSEADAELALALSREAEAEGEAQEAIEELKEVRREIEKRLKSGE
jgi:hypothetical protein